MRLLPCSLAATALAAFAATGGQAATRDWPSRDFDRVDLQAAADVSITTGPGFSVHADGDPKLLQRLTAEVRQGALVLGWQRGDSVRMHGEHIRVTITMPRIVGVGLSGAGTMTIDRVEAPDFAADIGGAGTIRVATLHSRQAHFAIGGTGTIAATGTTGQIDARVSGVGTIDAARLAARAGRVTMSGTGQIHARIDGPADVTMSGVGQVTVDGHPTCTIHKSGLGSVRCG